MMKKLLKEVAVLAMAAVVAVSSVSGVQAAVASPTVLYQLIRRMLQLQKATM